MFVHGVDNAHAGYMQMVTGEPVTPMTVQLLEAAGAPPIVAEGINAAAQAGFTAGLSFALSAPATAARVGTSVAGAASRGTTLSPNQIRFSQRSVTGVEEITSSMRTRGFVGDPIDVVRMPDGLLTTLDNTRVLAASRAGVDVRANIRNFDDLLPSGFAERFPGRRGEVPSTFGEAVLNRIGNQGAAFRERFPFGSPITGAR